MKPSNLRSSDSQPRGRTGAPESAIDRLFGLFSPTAGGKAPSDGDVADTPPRDPPRGDRPMSPTMGLAGATAPRSSSLARSDASVKAAQTMQHAIASIAALHPTDRTALRAVLEHVANHCTTAAAELDAGAVAISSPHRSDLLKLLDAAATSVRTNPTMSAEGVERAISTIVDDCFDLRSRVMDAREAEVAAAARRSRSTATAKQQVTAEKALKNLQGVLDTAIDNQAMVKKACDAFVEKIGPGAPKVDVDTISNIATLSSSFVEFIELLNRPRDPGTKGVQSVTRFLATNGLEIASTVVNVAKAAADFVPIPGLATAIGIIDKILKNIGDSQNAPKIMQAFCDDLGEIKAIIAPMANQWFSADVRRKCSDLVALLKEADAAVERGKADAGTWRALMGGASTKMAAQVESLRKKLAKIKELLSLAMQVDSAMMLMRMAKQLNIIDVKADKMLALLRPRTLLLRHDDFMVAPKPLDSSGSFRVFEAKMDGSPFVIKEFRDGIEGREDDLEAEAHRWFNANHPNLLQLTGICLAKDKQTGRGPFIAMPFVEHDLESFLAENPGMDVKTRINILLRVARGVKYLHQYAPDAPLVHGSLTMRHIRIETKAQIINDKYMLKIRKLKIVPSIGTNSASSAEKSALVYVAPELFKSSKSKTAENKASTVGIGGSAGDSASEAQTSTGLSSKNTSSAGQPSDNAVSALSLNLPGQAKPASSAPILEKPADIYSLGVLMKALLHDMEPDKVDAKRIDKPHGISDDLWGMICTCTNRDKDERPEISDVASALIAAAGSQQEWAEESELTASGLDPQGELVYVIDKELGRSVSLWRLSWDANHCLTSLRLTGCGFAGTIPKDIGRLTQLRELWLDQNEFEGRVPPQLSKLTKLTSLDISQNEITGLSGVLRGMPKLRSLDISMNKFREIPAAVFTLEALEYLHAESWVNDDDDDEEFRISEIPPEIGRLKNLTKLIVDALSDLTDNTIKHVPKEIGQLTGLRFLSLSGCGVEELPEEIGNLMLLDEILLDGNNLSKLPESFANLTNVERLLLNGNSFAALPACITELSQLRELQADECDIESLPESMGDLVDLAVLSLASNKLDSLPDSMRKLTELRDLNINDCAFSELPDWIGELCNLESLDVGENQTEHLPDSLCDLTQLRRLCLEDNSIESLPDNIGRLSRLTTLSAQNNVLSELPQSIGDLSSLAVLNLEDNSLESLPDTIGQLQSLENLSLSDNELEQLPESFARLGSLRELNLSSNRLSEFPQQIAMLTRLDVLNLSSNEIESIPDEIGRLSQLTILDLSSNEIEEIPEAIGQLAKLNSLWVATAMKRCNC
nr:hypothetical protein HK105_001868 [Polyrhizophydium stewartii]